MIDIKNIRDTLMELVVDSLDEPYVIGNGILTSTRIGFNKEKLESNMQVVASILQELGVSEHSIISLVSLTALKNGEVWNSLKSIDDFKTLELLLACSDACGFIHNDISVKQKNISEIGDLNSVLISDAGRSIVGDNDKWLKCIRDDIIGKMYFLTEPDSIKIFADDNQNPELPEQAKK